MIDSNKLGSLIGAPVHDNDGDKIGTVGQVYVDHDTNQGTWATVRTGFFGTSGSFVPLDDARWDDRTLTVPFEKEFVKNAPRVEDDGAISEEEEGILYSYYGTGHITMADTGRTATEGRTQGHDTSGPTTDTAMTRSEEQLHVGTRKVETGRARLRKFVVTENQTVTVPVSHEEVRITREPITEANRGEALDGLVISEEEHEIVLTAEKVIVDKEVVPVERIKLGTESVTEQQQVSEQVRKERIELIDPTDTGSDNRKTRTGR